MKKKLSIFVLLATAIGAVAFVAITNTANAPPEPEAPVPEVETLEITDLSVVGTNDNLAVNFSVSGFKSTKLIHAYLSTFQNQTLIASTSLRVSGVSNNFNFAPLPEVGNYIVSVVTDDAEFSDTAFVCLQPGPTTCTEEQNEAEFKPTI